MSTIAIEGAERVQVKLFAGAGAPKPADLIPVFHGWITDAKLDELVIDVADYSHVPDGPGVILIGHGSDYYYDVQGRPGLLYSRKRDSDGVGASFPARLEDALRRVVRAASLLDKEQGLRFDTGELLIKVPDRLHVRNDDEGFAAARPHVETALAKRWGAPPTTLEREGHAREALSLRATFAEAPPLEHLDKMP